MPTINTLGRLSEAPWEADARRMAQQTALMNAQWGRQDALQSRAEGKQQAMQDRLLEIAKMQMEFQKGESAAEREARAAAMKAEADYRGQALGLERERLSYMKPKTLAEKAADAAAAMQVWGGQGQAGAGGSNQNLVMGENPAMLAAKGAVGSPMGGLMLGPLAGTARQALELAQKTNAAPALTAPKLDLEASIEKSILNPSKGRVVGVDPNTGMPIREQDNTLDRLLALSQLREGREGREFRRGQEQRTMAETVKEQQAAPFEAIAADESRPMAERVSAANRANEIRGYKKTVVSEKRMPMLEAEAVMEPILARIEKSVQDDITGLRNQELTDEIGEALEDFKAKMRVLEDQGYDTKPLIAEFSKRVARANRKLKSSGSIVGINPEM